MRLSSKNVPLGVAVLVVVLLSLKRSGIDRPSQQLPLRTKLETMDPLGVVLLFRSVYLVITLCVSISTGLRPSSHNKYLRVFKSFNFSLAVFHLVGDNS